MQTFKFLIRHIPGVDNVLADSLSRQDLPEEDPPYELNSYGPEEILNFEESTSEQFASQTEDELVAPGPGTFHSAYVLPDAYSLAVGCNALNVSMYPLCLNLGLGLCLNLGLWNILSWHKLIISLGSMIWLSILVKSCLSIVVLPRDFLTPTDSSKSVSAT